MSTSTMGISGIVKSSIGWSIGLSVLMIVAGIFAIVVPPAAGLAVTVIVAWMLVLSGAVHFLFAWHLRSAGVLIWELLLGILYLAVGIYMLMHPLAAMVTLTIALAIYLFVEGILESVLSFQLRPMPGANWLLLDGIVTFILAIMIWKTWPANTEWVLGTLVGISMLFSGVSRLGMSMMAKRAAANLA